MIYRFADCELNTKLFELRRGGKPQSVERQVFDLLLHLVENRDRAVTKSELYEQIWQGRIVSEAALTSRIKSARQAVGDSGRDQRIIQTLRGRGFRFVGSVSVSENGDTALSGATGSDSMQRRLAAILAADVVGYSRLLSEDEAATLSALKAHINELIEPKVAEHHGRIVKLMGDGVLAEFPSAVEAVFCAIEIQSAVDERNTAVPEDRRIVFRIGINIGDVVAEGDDIYGDGVNVAARLEALSEAGGICISDDVHRILEGKSDLAFEDAGQHKVKNIARPVQVWRWTPTAGEAKKFGTKSSEPRPLLEKPSIAVRPFANLSDDAAQTYFSDGITDDIITELSRFRDLLVIARNSSFAYHDKEVEAQDVASDLSVRYVLEGSVRTAGERIRITAQLVDAETGHHIWAERYNRDLTDVFSVQDEIAQTVAATVAGRLKVSAQDRAVRKVTESLEAYDFLLRGQSIVGDTAENNLRARRAFEKAAELDPSCARAYAGQAQHHLIDWFCGWGESSDSSFRQALACATKAVKLDNADSKAQWMLGHIHTFGGEFEAAEVHLKRALDLNPNDADALCFMGLFLSQTGRAHESIDCFTAAMRLNPYFPSFYLWNLGGAYYNARRYEDALAPLKEFTGQHPNFIRPRKLLAATLAQIGRIEEARAVMDEVLAVEPDANIGQEGELGRRQYKGQNDLDHWLEGLRKAGLPE